MKRVWKFKTRRFCVVLDLEPLSCYRYDGDDENGETQRALDNGDLVAFDSYVRVLLDYSEIAGDSLGGSIYEPGKVSEFWTAHRDADPMNRNCTAYRAKHGENHVICHYFPDMVRRAVQTARAFISSMPELRGES